jgi:dTDP-glucose 4,6-dehydratase
VEERVRVLVTGATGFLGYHVVRYLLETTDCEVVTLDRHVPIHEDIAASHVIHDLRLPISSKISRLIGDVDAVINLASSSDVSHFLSDPAKYTLNNVTSTLNIMEWAKTQKLQAFIHMSTNEVYGPSANFDVVEWSPMIPQTPYSASKAAQEMIAIGWWKTYDVPVVIVNTMHVFGEYQPAMRFIPQVVQRLLAGEPVTLYGQKKYAMWQSCARQWTYAPDLAHALYWLLTNSVSLSVAGVSAPDRWNITGDEITCRTVAYKIAEQLGVDLEIDWQSWRTARPGYDMRYALDGTAFRKLGYTPIYGTAAGLRRTVDWLAHREKR